MSGRLVSTPAEAEILFGDIAEYIERAEACLDAEDTEALSTMGKAVDALSAQLGDLPPHLSLEYARELDYLSDKLRSLCKRMAGKQHEFLQALQVSDQRVRALKAYHGSNEGA